MTCKANATEIHRLDWNPKRSKSN